MKKLFFLFLGLMPYSAGLFAQSTPCYKPSAFTILHGNQVKAGLRNGGDLFSDKHRSYFDSDTASMGLSLIAYASLWLGGYDETGKLKVSAQTYSQSGLCFFPGPLDNAGTTNTTICSDWNRIWKASGADVRQFIYDFNNSQLNLAAYSDLLKWPGRNNPHSLQENGFALPVNQDFAPFFDKNNDGNYNPLDGDYPIVPNTNGSVVADDLAWTVFNDIGTGRTLQTNGAPLKAEVQMTFYAFNSTQATFLNNTIFGHYKVINKSGSRIDSLHIGMWEVPDDPCYNDSYMGSVPQQNTMYLYNITDTSSFPCMGSSVVRIPVFSTTFLDEPMSKVSYYIHNTPPTPPSELSDPLNAQEYFNYMSGRWRDSTRFTIGGNGYNPDSTQYTNYIFPDNPNNPAGWSCKQVALIPRYFRMLGTSYFSTWQPMEAKELTVAFGTHIDMSPSATNLTSVDTMYAHLPRLRSFHQNKYNSFSLTPINKMKESTMYPNPAGNNLTINLGEATAATLSLYHISGREIMQKQLSQNQTNLDVSFLSSGIYLVELSNEFGKTTHRFVK